MDVIPLRRKLYNKAWWQERQLTFSIILGWIVSEVAHCCKSKIRLSISSAPRISRQIVPNCKRLARSRFLAIIVSSSAGSEKKKKRHFEGVMWKIFPIARARSQENGIRGGKI